MKIVNRIASLILILTLIPAQFSASADAPELFFSEYIEGSSFNKAIEIYNGTGGPVDLSLYTMELYSNGSPTPSQTLSLSGTVASGDVFVIAHNSADASLKAAADLINSSVINWNGDDAVVLKNAGIVIDVIGQVGVDPGSYWGTGDLTTQNHTLRRKESICSGDTDSSDPFDPAPEWDGYPNDTFDGFGAHTADCGVVVEDTAPVVNSTSPANGTADVAIDADIEITFSEAIVAIDPWFSITCGSTGSHTAAISGGPTTFTLNPDTDFANLESCTVTVYAAQITDQDTEDPPDNMDADYAFNFTTEDVLVVNTDIIINELDADQVSTDSKEFVELYDYGVGNTNLSGLVLVLYNGNGDASYQAFDLDGYSTDAGGYFVLCGDATKVPNCDLDVSPDTNLIQNGADAAALYVGDAADFPNGTGVTTDGLVDAIVYDTSDSDDTGLLALLNPGQPQVNERGGGDGTGHSNQRCPNGSGGPLNTDTYDQYKPTPGAKNICVITPDVIINELDADQSGTDSAEFIELFDGGAGNTDLTDLVLVLFNGSSDTSYQAFDLDGISTGVDGYFVLCGNAANVDNCDLDVSPNTNLIQNGADAAALYYGDEADFPNGTGVTHDGLLDAIVYDTDDSDDFGLVTLLNPGQPQVNERAGGSGTTHSNQRCPNGSGGPNNTYTYAQFDPTPGAVNTCGIECGLPTTAPIHDIQGPGFASPYDGIKVDVEGIVTGDFQDGKSGFYIQEPDANIDADPGTSEGIFVYSTSLDVYPGDHVRVTGYVDEYYNLTEITSVSHLEICSSGNSVTPTAISLPLGAISDLEAYEGMLVTFPQPLVISEYYAFGRYGEIVVSLDRQFQPTAIFDPGSPQAAQLLAENLLSRITIDDGRGWENPDPAIHPNGLTFDLSNLFRGGDQLENVTGVVDYNYSEYKIQQTSNPVFTSLNPRTAAPDDVGGSLKIASFNVLNYFTTLDDGVNDICGPLGILECRGADTPEEFTRQRDKIIAALDALDADVVGLIEIENNEYEAVEDLVNGLNAAAGAGTYAYVDTGYIGEDAIKVALIYKPASVSLVGDYAILDSSVDSRFNDTKNRPTLAQTFMDNSNHGIFTVVVNHLKSKGSSCASIGDPDLGDGAGNCNLTRTSAAEAMVDWLATDPTNSGDADFLIIGDLNAYDKEDPIDAILAGNYEDLVLSYLGEDAYSYVFDGQLGYLDHALVMGNGGMVDQVTGATVWHINADEPSLIDYDMSYKQDAQDAIYYPGPFRSSDHDPLLIGLEVCDEIAPTLEITLSHDTLWPANHKYVDVTATVVAADNYEPTPVVTLISVTSSEEDNYGGSSSTEDDILIIDDYTFQLRAERSGRNKDGRVYTVTYQVEDDCGNITIGTAIVLVPHSMKIQ